MKTSKEILQQLAADIAKARDAADKMVDGLGERTQAQVNIRHELKTIATALRELYLDAAMVAGIDATDYDAGAAGPSEAEIAKLKDAVKPAGPAGEAPAGTNDVPTRPARRRPARPAKGSRAAKKR